MTRLGLNDADFQCISKMGDGHPGALSVLSAILDKGGEIDPGSLSPLIAIIDMDRLGIYGSRIWLLYICVCGEDLVATIGLIIANKLGLLPADELNHAIDNRGAGVDVKNVLEKVRDQLPAFGVAAPPDEAGHE